MTLPSGFRCVPLQHQFAIGGFANMTNPEVHQASSAPRLMRGHFAGISTRKTTSSISDPDPNL
jgi:hypothetical protein